MSLLDGTRFRLSDPDAADLLEVLLDLYKVDKRQVQILVEEVGYEPASIDWDGSLVDVWPEVLKKVAAAGKLRNLVKVIAARPESTAYAGDLQRFLSPPPPGRARDYPYGVCLMGGGIRPFINRSTLRDHLKQLERNDGSRVLIVNGPRSSGKSYSWYLISFVGENRSFASYLVDLEAWSGLQAGPADVMKEIASQLDWETPPIDPTAQEDTVARTLLGWFKGRIRKEPLPSWLIFDGLDRGTVSEAALRMIENMATAAERRQAGDLRVVLIAFGRPLPVDVDPYALREPLEPLDVQHVRDFFQSVAGEAGQEVDEAGLDQVVEQLLGPGPYRTPLALAELAPQAGRLARELFLGAGASGD